MKHLFIIFSLFYSSVILAQTDAMESELSLITVSANKYETPLFQTASSVTIINKQKIKLNQANTVVGLLKNVPGITISQQGGTGKLSSVFMRGANSNFVLVMIDNVEVNDPSSSNNAYDFSSLQISDIERIEIVRGPQSTLYGTEASAGVINILTKSGKGNPKFSAAAEGGTNNYYKGSISASGEISQLNYLVNFSHLKTDAVSSIKGKNFEPDGYLNNSGLLKFGYLLNNNFNVKSSYKYTGTKTDLDQAEKDGDDPNFTSNWESHLFNLNFNGILFDGKWESSLRGSYYKNNINALDKIDDLHPGTSSKSNFDGKRFSLNWQNNLKLIDNNLFTIGVDTKQDKANSVYHSESFFGPFDSNFPEESITTTGIYVQDLVTYNNFSTAIGYRFDNNEKFGSVTTYRIAPMYFIRATDTKFKGTYGTGFKAPSLFNLFAPFYGNSKLNPEKSKGWDLGFEQFLFNKRFMLGLTYFNMKFEDMLGFDENFKSININKAETKGVEVTLSIPNIHGFSLDANYTYTDANDISTDELSKQQLIRRPKNQFSVNANYNFEKLNLSLSIRHSGEKFDNDFSTFPSSRVSLKAYTVVDIRTSYDVTDYISVYGRVENLFDTKYEDILYYGTLGRSGYLGFRLNL